MRALALLLALSLASPAAAVTWTCAAANATDLRAVIGLAAAGDIVIVPAGRYSITTTITLTAPLAIVGEGDSTVIQTGSAAISAFTVNPTAASIGGHIIFRDLRFEASASGVSAIKTTVASGKSIASIEVDRCTATGYTNGFDVGGTGMTVSALTFRNSTATSCRGNGFTVTNVAGASLIDCAATSNNTSNGTSAETGSQVLLKSSNCFRVEGLTISGMPVAASAIRIGLCVSGCAVGSIEGANVSAAALATDSYGVRLVSSATGVRLGSLVYSNIAFPVTNDATSVYPAVQLRTIVRQ